MSKMTVETEFSIGQRVWVMTPQSVQKVKESKCAACEGEGVLHGKDKSTHTCPQCRGYGKVKDVSYYHKPISGTVNRIVLASALACSVGGGKDVFISYGVTNPKARGCHNRDGLYPESRVFSTKKACEEHIKHGLA